jgi:C-terminal processing protease CtpA/Prc
VVILIGDGTRSAKEIVVSAVQRRNRALLVGTPTAGHVTPLGALRRVGRDGLLMLPGEPLALEGRPTQPDVYVARDIRFSAGADPQLDCAAALLARLVEVSRVEK